MAKPRDQKPVLHTKKHIARLERERFQTRLILITFSVIVVSVAGLILYALLYPKYIQPNIPIAKVNNVPIPIGEWQARVRMQRSQLINQLQTYQQYAQYFGMDFSSQEQQISAQLDSSVTLGQSVLDTMVDEELIRQESVKRGIIASKDEIEQAVQADYQYFPNGTPTETITPTPVTFPTLSADTLALVTLTSTPTAILTPSPSKVPNPSPTGILNSSVSPTATVSPTSTATIGPTATAQPSSTPVPSATPYTLEGFQSAYKNGLSRIAAIGLDEAQIRQLYQTTILRQKLSDLITADVSHTQDQLWARHILVADLASANAVRQRLVNGEDFAKVAAEVSTDTGTKDKGGDLGWFGKGTMVPEFDASAFTLKVGEISQPVKSQYGYHIIQVLAHKNVPLDATAYSQAKQTAFNDWLKQARVTYKVVTFNNWQSIVPTDPVAPAVPQ